MLDELRSSADSDKIIAAFLSRARSMKTADRGTFRSEVVVIEPTTMLQAPAAEHFRIVSQGSKVAVEFKQRRFILPAEAQGTLEGMLQQRVFRTVDLPGGLSLDDKLTLIRTLFEKGFVSRHDEC